MNGTDLLIPARVATFRSLVRRHPTAASVAGSLVVAGALAVALAGKGGEFVAALGSAPLWVLGAAVGAVCFASWAVVDRFWRQPTPAGALVMPDPTRKLLWMDGPRG